MVDLRVFYRAEKLVAQMGGWDGCLVGSMDYVMAVTKDDKEEMHLAVEKD